MIMTIIAVLILLWLIGLIAHIGGGLIHILLVVALIVFIYDHTIGRRPADRA
jgi:4-hydroxybenzoate polyprenyltransferase